MERLKSARKAKGFTQEKLGKLVNVQKSAVSKYERGAIQPSQDILIRLSEALGVSTDYLLGNDKPNSASEAKPTDEDIMVALFDGDKDVSDKMWDEVKAFADFVKERERQKAKDKKD